MEKNDPQNPIQSNAPASTDSISSEPQSANPVTNPGQPITPNVSSSQPVNIVNPLGGTIQTPDQTIVNQTPAKQPPTYVVDGQQVAAPPHEKSNPVLMILITLIILILLGGVGFFGYKYFTARKPAQTNSGSNVVDVTESPAAMPDWKIYSNQSVGVSFSYPADLTFIYDNLKDYETTQRGSLILQNYDREQSVPEGLTQLQFSIVEIPLVSTSLQDYALSFTNPDSPSIKSTKVGGFSAVRVMGKLGENDVDTLIIEREKEILSFQLTTVTESSEKIFDEMLSTLKFSPEN